MYTKRHPFPKTLGENTELYLEHDLYKNNITDPPASIPEPETLSVPFSKTVVVSSALRDRSRFTNPAEFTFEFDYKNVQKVELVGGFIPTLVPAPAFLYLSIEGLDHIEVGNGKRVFQILTLKESRGFTEIDTGVCSGTPFIPLNQVRLFKSRVQLIDPQDGRAINLANEPDTLQLDATKQITLVLKITQNVLPPISSSRRVAFS